MAASRHGESLLACIKKSEEEQVNKYANNAKNPSRQKSLPSQSSLDKDKQPNRNSYIEKTESLNGERHPSQSLDVKSLSSSDQSGEATSYSSVDRLTYVTAVERLLVQLEETESTFEDFWLQHHTHLTQCLQLRRFEADFKDVQVILIISVYLLISGNVIKYYNIDLCKINLEKHRMNIN